MSTYVQPVMKGAGFAKHRVRKWMIESPDGHVVIVQMRPYDMDEKFGFHVEWAAVPVVLRQFFGETATATPKMEWGLINTRLRVPVQLRLRPTNSSLWWFYREKLEEFGPTFRAFLVDHAIPLWWQALVPAQLLELLKGPDFEFPNQPAVADPLRVQIVLQIDDSDPAELHHMIDEAERKFPSNDLLVWLRQRLRDRESS